MRLLLRLKPESRISAFILSTLLALVCLGVKAQTITISPKTGNVIAAHSYQQENHLAGYGGAWVHNQLPMNLFTSDYDDLTDAGLPKTHANNIAPKGDKFVWYGGVTRDGFFTISLPKGYRFTGYKMVLTNNVTDADFPETFGKNAYSMTERSGSFTGDVLTTVNLGKRNVNSTTEYTLQRTSNDMGNILYFRLGHTSGEYAAVYVQSLEISFECDQNISTTVRPSAASTSGVDCAAVSFNTGRMDIGSITWSGGSSTGQQNKAWRYNYNNVKDLQANFMLFDEDGISAGSASTSSIKNGNIKATSVNGGLHYALQNDVYYLETPTEAITQNDKSIPVGYRITGAKLHYYANIVTPAAALGNRIYITDGSGKYMNTSLKFTSTPVVWQTDAQGYVWTTDGDGATVYLTEVTSSILGTTHTLKITTTKTTKFGLDDTGLYYKATFTHYVTKEGKLGGNKFDTNDAAKILSAEPSTGGFTLNLYGTDGSVVAKTVKADASNTSGTLEVSGLNNDAIKFEVTELTGTAAYVYAELTLEALNPYISKMDVVATTAGGDATIAQSYLADDFTVGDNGKITFSVPDNFASSGVQLSFDNLNSKCADDTYGPFAADGNSRYHFVHSAYYTTIGENLQAHRTDAADHSYTDKIKVSEVGSKQFQVNNSDDFKVGTSQSTKEYSYVEYRYTNAAYTTQGGTWNAVNLTRTDATKDCYLVTCDETRYNLAPTTTPRHAFYAFYNTSVTLNIADYEPQLTYVKVYDNAMLQTGFDSNAYYGVKVGAKMKDTGTAVEDGTGYLFAKQILDQINEDKGKDNCPTDAAHVLYIDASSLTSVLSSATDPDTYGKLELLQDAIGKNAMIYLPAGVTYTLKNIASRTVSGDFKAENDIVLTDKQPFFAPYDIRVDANNTTEYLRGVTYTHGKTKYVSLVLPFTMDIADATHKNTEGTSEFKLYTMQLTNAISAVEEVEGKDYQITGHFTPAEGLTTESNKPYLVEVLSYEESEGTDQIFVARQHGATIVKTPTVLEGESANGKIGTESVVLTHHGTFNGVQLEHPASGGAYFYFNKDRFVSSAGMVNKGGKVYIMPFRTYFDYKGANLANAMEISLDPNEDVTAIFGPTADAAARGFQVTSAQGMLTVTATQPSTVSVRTISGQRVATLRLSEGESQSVSLAGGIYLVNEMKVLVK